MCAGVSVFWLWSESYDWWAFAMAFSAPKAQLEEISKYEFCLTHFFSPRLASGTPGVTQQTASKSCKLVLRKAVDSLGASPEKTEKTWPNRESQASASVGLGEVCPQVRMAVISPSSSKSTRKTTKAPGFISPALSLERNLVPGCVVEES